MSIFLSPFFNMISKTSQNNSEWELNSLMILLLSLNICIEGQGDFFLCVIMFIKSFKINKNS